MTSLATENSRRSGDIRASLEPNNSYELPIYKSSKESTKTML
jgi:hypothetical protein